MTHTPSVVLEPKYYLTNFTTLLSGVKDLYQDLLNESEQQWLARFYALEEDEQCLLVRMMTRKGEWFRSDKLRYSELTNPETLLANLALSGFVDLALPDSPKLLADTLLTKPELLALFPKLPKSLRKSELVALLPEQMPHSVSTLPFQIIRLVDNQILPMFCLLFFGNRYQEFAQFVLENLGIHKFEQYEISVNTRIFHTREELDSSFCIGEMSLRYEEINRKSREDLIEFSLLLPAPHGKHANRMYQKLINSVARDLERCGALDEALALFQQSNIPPSRERQARILKAQGRQEEALSITKMMLADPYSTDESEVAERIASPLKKKLGIPLPKKQVWTLPEVHRQLDLTNCRVEVAVVEALKAEGWDAFYLENQFLNTLFGLAFWDILFSPVEGAFINPYQRQPLDLYRKEFIDSRSVLIEDRLKQIRSEGIAQLVAVHLNKNGLQNPFILWELVDASWIELAMYTISNQQLAGLFEVILEDIRAYRAGQPDVIAFKNGDFMWCEVKGPGDKLQHNQKRWMKHFERLNISYHVCYVNHR